MLSSEKIKVDWLTACIYMALVIFGWVNIYAAVYDESHSAVLDFSVQHGKQLIWMGSSFFLALCLLFVEPKVFSNTAFIIYGVVLLLLLLTLAIGTTTKGGQSWIDFGFFKFQASEFAKVGTALALAKYLSTIDLDIRKFRTKVWAFLIILVPAILVLLQHDTGSMLVFASFILPLFREGLSGIVLVIGLVAVVLFVLALLVNRWLLLGIIALLCIGYLFVWLSRRSIKDYWHTIIVFLCCSLFVFSTGFVFNNVLEKHQQNRINVLLGKTEDLKGDGYNQNQSKIAIGSGALFGKGFLKGTITKADFVPEQETDFIFCTVGEEWGFMGSMALVGLYVWLLLRLVMMAERQRSTFARVYGYCVASILFMHFFINIGMVLGLLPVIGIPLPFFSYGGSSLMAFTILLYIFIRQDAERNLLL